MSQSKNKKIVLALVALSALTIAILLLPASLGCFWHKFYLTSSVQGSSVLFLREISPRGDSTMSLAVQKPNGWLFLGYVEDSGFGKIYPGAFWSKDGTVIVAQNNSENLFGYDFKARKSLRKNGEITRVLKERGGAGKKIFRGINGFNRVSRHPWWWELAWLRESTRET